MISKEEFIVLNHYLKEGLSKTAIAQKLGINRRTVHRYIKSKKTEPIYTPRQPKPCLLDPYRDYIHGRLKVYPELTAIRLMEEIVPLGYKGSYSTVKVFVRYQRPERPLSIETRFEVSPGEQAQADFAVFKTSFGVIYAFLVVLSWSRYLWVRFYYHQDQLTVLNGLQRAFISFGGVPKTVLFDRMKAAVNRTGPDGRAVFNEEMLRFAAHHGFRPKACQPYRAKTKGRVERAVSYLRQSFFYGRVFRDLDDLNKQVETWLTNTANCRLHGTTNETPISRIEQEAVCLKPLNMETYIPVIAIGRRISKDGYICYNGNEYSVPEGLGRAEVEVKASLKEIGLYQNDRLLAIHPVLDGRGKRYLAPGHRRKLKPCLRYHDISTDETGEFIHVERRPLDVYEEILR